MIKQANKKWLQFKEITNNRIQFAFDPLYDRIPWKKVLGFRIYKLLLPLRICMLRVVRVQM